MKKIFGSIGLFLLMLVFTALIFNTSWIFFGKMLIIGLLDFGLLSLYIAIILEDNK